MTKNKLSHGAWRGLNVFVSLTTIIWSIGVANLAVLLIPAAPAFAIDTGFNVPTATGSSHNQWSNPTNAFASDDLYATETHKSHTQSYENFNFVGPLDATINGIEVSVEAKNSDSSGCEVQVKMWSESDNEHSDTIDQAVNATDQTYTLGGPTNLWGSTWIPNDFSNPNFHVEVRYDDIPGNSCDGTMSLDQIKVKVYYTDPPQPATNPTLGQSCGLDIALVLDSSGSIDSTELTQMKNAFKAFVDTFLPGTPTMFSVTDFDDTASILQVFSNDATIIKNAINTPASGEWTNWQDGLLKAQSTFDPRSNPNLVIFASDGNPNRIGNPNQTVSENVAVNTAMLVANDLKTSGTRILTLGIGNDLDLDNLKAISGPNVNTGVTSDVITTDFSTIANDLAALATELCGGTITATKIIDQDGDLQTTGDQTPGVNWSFNVAGQDKITDQNGQTQAVEVNAGTYDVSETVQPGFSFLAASCVGATNNGTPGSGTVTGIQVGNQDIVSCTFYNQQLICIPGNSQNCSTGLYGICETGNQTCSENGVWGGCEPDFQPGQNQEICDNGLDDDCDGYTDVADTDCYECIPGATKLCNTEQPGVCADGIETCSSNGLWGDCIAINIPTAEICDGLDNNCNGVIDEDLTRSCYNGPQGTAGVGICQTGSQICSVGQWGECTGEVTPAAEVCDDLDNDCNDQVDENNICGQAPFCGDGEINQTSEQCDDGNVVAADGCNETCQLEQLTCQDLKQSNNGWYGRYYNYSASHPDMNISSGQWPDKTHGDPLGAWTADWYNTQYFKFSRIDNSITFGENFFPLDFAAEENDYNGHDFHFGARWSGVATVETPGDYGYVLTSDDDSWVYLDGVLVVDNSGIHAPTTKSGTLHLTGHNVVDIFFAERHTTQSHFSFNWDSEDVTIIPYFDQCPECGNYISENDEECDAGPTGSGLCSPSCEVAPACDPNVELIVNGSFENPIVTNLNNWDIFNAAQAGWNIDWVSLTPSTYGSQTRPGTTTLEFHKAGLFSGSIPDGNQYAELDGDWGGPNDSGTGEPASVKISQELETWPGYQYQVSFDFSPRPNTTVSNNVLEFNFDGTIDTLSLAGSSSLDWSSHSYNVTADDYTSLISFADKGTSDSLGTFLDKVSVRCIPPGQAECNNDIYEPANDEECDGTANVGEHQRCSNECKLINLTYCGDNAKQTPNDEGIGGPVNDGNEECDGTDTPDGYNCNGTCEISFGRAYCGDEEVNQAWEQCDGGEGCTEQCRFEEQNECSDLVLAKIDIADARNYTDAADMTANIYLGEGTYYIPNQVWFPLYWNGSAFTDPDIAGYENVPGLAVQRLAGQIRAVMHGSHITGEDIEHVDGTIELYNATVTGQSSDNANGAGNSNQLERGFDSTGVGLYLAGNDEVWTSDSTHSDFWLTTTTADDGFYTDWAITEDCIGSICGYKYYDTNKDGERSDEAGIDDWTIQLLQSVACEPEAEWADTVIIAVPGLKKDGTPVDANRSIPEQGLVLETGQNVSNFVSLGFGGSITVGFTNIIVDSAGNDIKITEDTWGGGYPLEKADVYASQDGISWVLLGEADNTNLDLIHTTSEFDLSGSGLTWAQYVKVVDTTDPAIHGPAADGYDLNAVEALNCIDRWEVIDTEITDETGHYCFAPLDEGSYRVQEVLQTGWTNSTSIYQDVTLAQTQDLGVDFGNYEVELICNDNDHDGYYGSGDDGCEITDCNDDPETGANIHPGAEEVCDEIDNNCNDQIDEGLQCDGPVCETGQTQSCATGNPGICAVGTQTCSDGSWGECIQTNQSSTEVCDDLDNDCDGSVDEGLICDDGPVCGNQICESGETCSTCSADCGSCGGGGGGGGGGPTGLYIHNEDANEGAETTSVLITWFTNKPATSRVVYDTVPHPSVTTPPNYGYQWSTGTYDEGLDKVTYHSILITGLTTGTTYYFRPISAVSSEVFGIELTYVANEGGPTGPVCGNLSCETGEDCSTCATDCGACSVPPTGGSVPPPIGGPVCGNLSCETGETCATCAVDCGACSAGGTGIVAGAETEEGTVAGVEYEEPTTTEEVIPELLAEPTSEEPEAPVVESCTTIIWLILVLNLIAAAIVGYKNRNSRSWKKFLWLIGLVVILIPFIWYPACWIWIWLLVTLILLIIAAILKADDVQGNPQS